MLKSMEREEYKHKAKASELWDEKLADFIQLLYCKQHKFFKAWVKTLDYRLHNKYEEQEYKWLMKRAKILFNA